MRISKGFTLIEMLVVMSVLALLLTIALPQYFGSLGKSKDVALQENLRILRVVIDQFHADKGRFPATLQELVDEKYLRAVPVDPVTQSSASWILTPARNRDDSGVEDVRSGAPGSSQDGVAYGSM
ncbi:prepilin-type N-terminal cleavage/methylation domain-containing protein [Verminephrobacter eiseniae]|uniref:type II secretion system protein n=1 Tax=Verminephrobacter eiseniae TaxID=364317 RepID=UPI002237FE9C|nr:type II secretion system GspH family protein [Verminephrobacter eiseniae]MCW5233102.1 prepilin-type N-terminal cleavage/methylation domain-containing protein [Verminephrobacter eiseniae]MCW5261264.1 prepilin-type N-terminal cleavage/methylation domain-containing protein [Verminephrobacter eiseniae]